MEYFIKLIKKKKEWKGQQSSRKVKERIFLKPLPQARFEELYNDLFRKPWDLSRKPWRTLLLKEFFDGNEPNKGVNPDEAVAYTSTGCGTADLGNETVGGVMTRCNGVLNVRAKDKASGRRSEKITIANDKDRLAESEEEEKIDSAIKDALEWLEDKQNAEEEDFAEKLKEGGLSRVERRGKGRGLLPCMLPISH
ncbi:hypothetical protein QQP08_011627, partial [Theobroma cacao]